MSSSVKRLKNLPADMAVLMNAAIDQGWKIKETTSGFRLMPSGGKGSVGMHFTPSDHRTYLNTRAQMRRIGLKI